MVNKWHRQTRRRAGGLCAYCARPMSLTEPGLYPTRDHHVPRSKGGRSIVWCCVTCNAVKRDMTPDQWATYRADHDRWWEPENSRRAKSAGNWKPFNVVEHTIRQARQKQIEGYD